jgi:hypothetical protein
MAPTSHLDSTSATSTLYRHYTDDAGPTLTKTFGIIPGLIVGSLFIIIRIINGVASPTTTSAPRDESADCVPVCRTSRLSMVTEASCLLRGYTCLLP